MKGVLSPYQPNSWFNPIGVKRKQKELMEKMPNLKGCLALTLTYDPDEFAGPEAAFDKGNDRIRRIKDRLKRGITWNGERCKISLEYLRKLEFHKNDWPHFHLILKTRRYLDVMLLNHLWGYGLVKVQRIRNNDFHYLFKYVAKDPGELPDWVKKRHSLRIMQSSRNFFEKPTASKNIPSDSEDTEPSRSSRPYRSRNKSTIGERIEKWERTGMFRTDEGRYIQIPLYEKYNDIIRANVIGLAKEGRYLGNKRVAIESRSQVIQWTKYVPDQLLD